MPLEQPSPANTELEQTTDPTTGTPQPKPFGTDLHKDTDLPTGIVSPHNYLTITGKDCVYNVAIMRPTTRTEYDAVLDVTLPSHRRRYYLIKHPNSYHQRHYLIHRQTYLENNEEICELDTAETPGDLLAALESENIQLTPY